MPIRLAKECVNLFNDAGPCCLDRSGSRVCDSCKQLVIAWSLTAAVSLITPIVTVRPAKTITKNYHCLMTM